jgi:hypothetical protein
MLKPEPSFEIEPGLKEFLNDAKLSAGITDEETAFLKSLSLDGKRPSLLYYYRELQNLRDPLNFLPLSPAKRREPEGNALVVKSRRKTAKKRGRRPT